MIKSHYTGQSQFVDDIIATENEVLVGLVGAPVAAGRLVKIDSSRALEIPGVLGVFTAQDFHEKHWGSIKKDQPFLVVDEIGYKHEPVCAIAATDPVALAEAKRALRIEVQEQAPILDIETAYKQKHFLVPPKSYLRGDCQQALTQAPRRHRGVLRIGGQEHFYLEPQSCLVVPSDSCYLKVFSATQHTTETQQECAAAAGLGFHQVGCEARRLGGGFGGKETQASHFAAIAAVVAHRLQRPARLVLNRDDDFLMTGKRHPFLAEYQVGYDDEGNISALRLALFANGGAYLDLTPSILDRALYHADGAYYIPHVEIIGCAVKTNTPSNTALRGFGGPQGNLAMENILEEVAQRVGVDAALLRERHLYREAPRNVTHYGQTVENNLLHTLYDRVMEVSAYHERRQQVTAWNQSRQKTLRGLALSFTKFGISFTSKFLNQASSLLHLQIDGTAQVSTGAVEMGQGVQIKIARVVARELGIDLDKIQVLPTSTERTANTSPTAASTGADMNGMATQMACAKVKANLIALLERFRMHGQWQELGEGIVAPTPTELQSWQFKDGFVIHSSGSLKVSLSELCAKARLCRVGLSALAHYKTPELENRPFYYYTQGAAVSEVEIERSTGKLKILRSDLVMDLGTSLDQKVDRGQIAGAFVQGVGWMTMEELVFDQKGELKTHSPSTYKIPLMTDLPEQWSIEVISNPEFNKNIFNSKAVGEPPLLLSASVWLAIKDALGAVQECPQLRVPATNENILSAMLDWEKESHERLVVT